MFPIGLPFRNSWYLLREFCDGTGNVLYKWEQLWDPRPRILVFCPWCSGLASRMLPRGLVVTNSSCSCSIYRPSCINVSSSLDSVSEKSFEVSPWNSDVTSIGSSQFVTQLVLLVRLLGWIRRLRMSCVPSLSWRPFCQFFAGVSSGDTSSACSSSQGVPFSIANLSVTVPFFAVFPLLSIDFLRSCHCFL